MSRFDAYILCTSPRSGSTLLCALLKETRLAGRPGSHFHEPSLDAWSQKYHLDRARYAREEDALRAVLRAAIARGTGGSDLFGLRLQQHSFAFFTAQLGRLYPGLTGDQARIEAAFGRTLFIHLTRASKLDQAISFIRAEQSGLWHKAPDGTELERLSSPKPPHYDGDAIAAQMDQFMQMETAWTAWFAQEDITPLRLTYDALSAAPYDTLAQVLDALGLPHGSVHRHTPPVAKLADEISRSWAKRFSTENAPSGPDESD